MKIASTHEPSHAGIEREGFFLYLNARPFCLPPTHILRYKQQEHAEVVVWR